LHIAPVLSQDHHSNGNIQLHRAIDVTLEPRLVAPRFLTTFPIGCDDGIDDLTAQQALPSTGASARSFSIFQCGRDHQAVTAKTVHLVILSESE